MRKSDINPMPKFFDRYINLVQEEDMMEALHNSRAELDQLDMDKFARIGLQVYEPGKWTLNDLFQHMCDTERIMTYRALRFARRDHTPLAGFDENNYAEHTEANERPLEEIISELKVLRDATILLFGSLSETALESMGTANGKEISAGAIGFMIPGHQIHHMNVIRERYYGLG